MGDRHGGRFARRGRALNPPRPQVDAHRGVGFRWRATVFRCRGAVDRICPAQEYAPRRRPPDTAHERKDLPHARRLSSAKGSRHGARAKGFAPRENAPHGEGLQTRRTSERSCPAQERSLGEGLPTRRTSERICPAGTRPSEKASRHGARAKGFAPRRNTLLGEGIPTRRTSKRICSAGVRVRPTCRRTAGRPRPTDSRKTPLRRGRTHSARPLPSSFTEKNKTTP